MKVIPYSVKDYKNLPVVLNAYFGSTIEFDNGCTAYLENDEGIVWGSDPYGLDWGCNFKQGWEASLVTWLKFWDSDRDEQGNLLRD